METITFGIRALYWYKVVDKQLWRSMKIPKDSKFGAVHGLNWPVAMIWNQNVGGLDW